MEVAELRAQLEEDQDPDKMSIIQELIGVRGLARELGRSGELTAATGPAVASDWYQGRSYGERDGRAGYHAGHPVARPREKAPHCEHERAQAVPDAGCVFGPRVPRANAANTLGTQSTLSTSSLVLPSRASTAKRRKHSAPSSSSPSSSRRFRTWIAWQLSAEG